MGMWFLIIATACIAALLKVFVSLRLRSKLPPGPPSVPIISSIILLWMPTTQLEAALKIICSIFGPIVSLSAGSHLAIFISDSLLFHQAFVQKGAIFADRPNALPTASIMASNRHNVSFAGYGPVWSTLRRNMTAFLHPSRSKDFSHARRWVLNVLNDKFKASATSDGHSIKVMDHFRYAMFCLLVFMCFGDKLDASKIREIQDIQRRSLTSFRRFLILDVWPSATRILLPGRWNELVNMRKELEEVLSSQIKARQQAKTIDDENSTVVGSYVDTLLTLELSENDNTKQKLSEEELVTVCSEFLNAGTDGPSTALEWIMANMVKYPKTQAKLFEEIKGVIGEEAEEIREEELSRMPYLKAVILEGLRRHPPVHFLVPHSVTREVELGGYIIPKDAIINVTIAEMSHDSEVWKNPMEFKPERFPSSEEGFDVTGSRVIKMMPFGVGRRICPGYGLAMLHLEYFVANLVWKFEWAAVEGYEVDLSEKEEFSTVMKHPLEARISPRTSK